MSLTSPLDSALAHLSGAERVSLTAKLATLSLAEASAMLEAEHATLPSAVRSALALRYATDVGALGTSPAQGAPMPTPQSALLPPMRKLSASRQAAVSHYDAQLDSFAFERRVFGALWLCGCSWGQIALVFSKERSSVAARGRKEVGDSTFRHATAISWEGMEKLTDLLALPATQHAIRNLSTEDIATWLLANVPRSDD